MKFIIAASALIIVFTYLIFNDPIIKPTPSNWQSYVNPDLNFTFQYPENFEFLPFNPYENDQVDTIKSPDYLVKETNSKRAVLSGISYSIYRINGQCGDLTSSSSLSKIESIPVDGQKGLLYHHSLEGETADGVQIPYLKNCIYIIVHHGPNYDPVWSRQFRQILSTLKFPQK